jgi:hypothetical protein
MHEMGRRWLTPDRLSMYLLSRARKAIRSTTSWTNGGMNSLAPSRMSHASCAVTAIPSSRVSG